MQSGSDVSRDSYGARRALRPTHRDSSSEPDEEQHGNAGVQGPNGPATRPGAPHPQGATGKEPKRVQRAKLTYEQMTSNRGIPLVFKTFQDTFRRQYKGAGHEAADLGRLLDMYETWQKQLFPHCDFDTFASRLLRLHTAPGSRRGKVATLKGEMDKLRESVIQLLLDQLAKADAEHGAAEAAQQQQQADTFTDGDGPAGHADSWLGIEARTTGPAASAAGQGAAGPEHTSIVAGEAAVGTRDDGSEQAMARDSQWACDERAGAGTGFPDSCTVAGGGVVAGEDAFDEVMEMELAEAGMHVDGAGGAAVEEGGQDELEEMMAFA